MAVYDGALISALSSAFRSCRTSIPIAGFELKTLSLSALFVNVIQGVRSSLINPFAMRIRNREHEAISLRNIAKNRASTERVVV